MGINSVLDHSNIYTPVKYLIIFGLTRIVGVAIQEYRQILLNKVSNGAIVDFSKDMMNYLMKLEYHVFKTNSEFVMNSFNKSLQGIERLNRFVLGNIMSNVAEITIISIMLYTLLGPKYFINTILTYLFYMFVTRKISNYRQSLLQDKWKAEINSENKLFDIIYNIDTVKYFQREEGESEKYANIIKGVRQKDQKATSSLSILNSSQNLIISTGMVVNLCMGVYDCFYGTLTPGDLVMLQAIFTQIMMPLNFMGMLMREVDETRVNLKYAIEMIYKKEEIKKTNTQKQLFIFNGGKIEFKNVSFGFTENNQILSNLNATFQPGSLNAIVGQSGQGKSTLFNLIYKLYEPNSGKIIIDDQDINEVDLDSYRKYLTICPQNGNLFNDSVLYNIQYGNVNSSQDEVDKITKNVNIYNKIIGLEEKFLTSVGSLGSKLSGGEKQRLLLARSFMKNANIVLLDEPTSNLDSYNESIVLRYLMKIKDNKTILINAHKYNLYN